VIYRKWYSENRSNIIGRFVEMKRIGMPIDINYEIDENMELTNYAGLGIIIKLMEMLNIFRELSVKFGMKVRNKVYSEFNYIYLLLINFLTGGGVIRDIERFKNDKVFQKLFNFSKDIPNSSAIYKFLYKANKEAVERFYKINNNILKKILKLVYKNRKKALRVYCFMDSSELEVYGKDFEGASKNYNGDMALRIHAIFLEDFLVSLRLYSPKGHNVTYGWEELLNDLKSIQDIIGSSEIYIMMDSAYYDYDLIDRIEKEGWKYSITAKNYPILFDEADIISESDWEDNYSSFEYFPEKRDKSYRIVVKREEKEEKDLFFKYDYHFIITNNREETPQKIFSLHSTKMGMENHFKDLLIYLNLHHPRQKSLFANRFYYQIGMLAYNLIKAIQYLKITGHDFFLSIKSFILRYIFIPGKLVTYSNKLTLKIPYFPGGKKHLYHLLS